jgi:hypothetical protein
LFVFAYIYRYLYLNLKAVDVEPLFEVNWNFEVKGKAIHFRSGHALRIPEGRGSQISRHSAHEGGKVVTPTHRPPLPQEYPGTHF